MEKFIITILGLILISFIYWFFFGKKEEGKEVSMITVDGGYKPGTIKVKAGVPTKLSFLRKDENSCLEEIIFPDFKIKKYLPLNQNVEIEIHPEKPGTYEFHCGMNMYKGKIVAS